MDGNRTAITGLVSGVQQTRHIVSTQLAPTNQAFMLPG